LKAAPLNVADCSAYEGADHPGGTRFTSVPTFRGPT